jgi:hypothetical protein
MESGFITSASEDMTRSNGSRLKVTTPAQDGAVLELLKKIRLPGERVMQGFRIYGYVPDGTPVNYIQ